MGLYSTKRTATATVSQVAQMIRAQKDALDLLDRKNIDSDIVKSTFTSYAGAVLGLVFYTSVPGAIGFGLVSLLGSLDASQKSELKQNVKDGLADLQDIYFVMQEGSWASVTMTITENRERPGVDFSFIKKAVATSYKTPTGETTVPN